VDARPRHERVVVIKHAFLPQDFEVILLQLHLIPLVDHVYYHSEFFKHNVGFPLLIFTKF